MDKRRISREELEQKIEEKEQLLESDFNAMTDDAREHFSRFLKIAVPISIAVVTVVGVTAWTLAARQARREATRVAVRGTLLRTLAAGALVGIGSLIGRGRSTESGHGNSLDLDHLGDHLGHDAFDKFDDSESPWPA